MTEWRRRGPGVVGVREVTATVRTFPGCTRLSVGDGGLKGIGDPPCRQGALTEDPGSLLAGEEQETRAFKPFFN